MRKQNTRVTILAATLLVLLFGYLSQPYWYLLGTGPQAAHVEPPLPGENEILEVKIEHDDTYTYKAKVVYFFRGDPQLARVFAQATDSDAPDMRMMSQSKTAQRGKNEVEVLVGRPQNNMEAATTKRVFVALGSTMGPSVHQFVDFPIEWPDFYTYINHEKNKSKTVEELYQISVAKIDEGRLRSTEEAKSLLEQIVLRRPDFVPAYIELARVAMTINRGPVGLEQAEKHLASAFQLDPESANAKVLLGYVYAHQNRYAEAASQFQSAAKQGTRNLWLWSNWGQLYLMQHKSPQAIEKYLQAVDGARTYDTYDHARLEAYEQLFALLDRAKQYDRMEALYKKRAEEFEKYACFVADYGSFRLRRFGDYESAIEKLSHAAKNGCDSKSARQSLGIAYYYAWSSLSGAEQVAALAQARVFFPEGPELLYELARDDRTSKLIPRLVTGSSSWRASDDEELNALGRALKNEDIDAARRLMKLGARLDDPMGPRKVPVAFVPFMVESVVGVRFVVDSGADLTRITFEGTSLAQLAARAVNPEISEIAKKSKGHGQAET
jgi:tetratricopeptide (TPR) repeat protein